MENSTREEKVISSKKRKKSRSMRTIFIHTDTTDKWLMALGLLSAIGDGLSLPIMLLVTSKLVNNLGNGPSADSDFTSGMDKVTDHNSVYLSVCALARMYMNICT